MNKCYYLLLFLALIIGLVFLLGYIEDKDMKEINDAYYDTNFTDPMSVMEYLHLVQTKPMWRVGLMISLLLSYFVMIFYIYSNNMFPLILFLAVLAFVWIAMIAYQSYFSFHVITPNGGQENYNKLRTPMWRTESKFS